MNLGVDFSQYGGPLTQQQLDCWSAQGVKQTIVQYSELMPAHLQALHADGRFEIEGYVYLYWVTSPWNQTPEQRTQLAIDMAARNGGISRLWLDAEDETQRFTPDQLRRCIKVCEANNIPCGIYSGKWWWDAHAQGVTEFSYLPLWDAYYLSQTPVADLTKMPQNFDNWRPYGGWSTPLIWQWHNTTALCGHSVDLNCFENLWPSTPIKEGDNDMISNHAWATWFEGREIAGGDPIYLVQMRTDFSLPADAKAAMFEAHMDAGSNLPEFLHGNSDMNATSLGAQDTPNGKVQSFIANMDERGTVNMRCLAPVKFRHLHCVGYFR